jgi:cephalosporin hydroxylase
MRLLIDTDANQVVDLTEGTRQGGSARETPLYSPEGFAAISQAWLRAAWGVGHSYSFTWLGRPIIQSPEDMFRLQEVIFAVRPDVLVETGVAHGGSLVFYASLCRLLGQGRVVGVDIEVRPVNRRAIEAHPLSGSITLIEGSSIDPLVVERVRQQVRPGETVMVLLDSCHSRAHVLAELEAYGPLVTPGSYIVAMDGVMADLVGVPGARPDWAWNNPQEAVRDFVARHPEFTVQPPAFLFNEGQVNEPVTFWPSAYVQRVA